MKIYCIIIDFGSHKQSFGKIQFLLIDWCYFETDSWFK